MLDELDLDQYNITSDDLRSASQRMPKANNTKGHPLVPKLNFKKIFELRERQN